MNESAVIASSQAEQLKSGVPILSFTKGVSMRPLLTQGRTCVTIVPLAGEPELGDMLLFQPTPELLLLHRLVDKRDGLYITRGDNCLTEEVNRRDQLLGVVTEITTKNGTMTVSDACYLRYVRWLNASWPLRRALFRIRSEYRRLRHAFGKTAVGEKLKKRLYARRGRNE